MLFQRDTHELGKRVELGHGCREGTKVTSAFVCGIWPEQETRI